VNSIDDNDDFDFAIVRTSRGDIRATNVVHATNAWIGHLLPELRPYVSPVRVNVVHFAAVSDDKHATVAGKSPFKLDSKYSLWLRYGEKDYDYLIQRDDGGLVVGRACTGSKATSDDSITDLPPLQHLRGFAEETLTTAPAGSSAHIDRTWSGIVAFTHDGVPCAGRLPFPGRKHQWVCGAFHGTGMIKSFRTSQNVAAMIMGEKIVESFPASLLVTPKRISGLRNLWMLEGTLDISGKPDFRSSFFLFLYTLWAIIEVSIVTF
jgi:glycine/D-amino acid oxidase-like deaminating enzyme